MNRRRFIAAMAAVGFTTTAGCSGGGGEPTPTPTPEPTPTPSPTPTTPNPAATEAYNAAIEALVENKEELDTWAEEGFVFESEPVETISDRLETANEELDATEEAARSGGSLMAKIPVARGVATLQETHVTFYDAAVTIGQLAADAGAFSNNEQHERAAEKYAEAVQLVEDLRGVLDDMETLHGELDTAPLDEPDLAYDGPYLDYIDLEAREQIDAAADFYTGFEQANLAFVQLQKAQVHWEDEAFADARADWETGQSRLETSLTSFEAVVDNQHASQSRNDTSIDMIGVVETVMGAFDTFIEASHEAEAGNMEEANQLIQEGFATLGEI